MFISEGRITERLWGYCLNILQTIFKLKINKAISERQGSRASGSGCEPRNLNCLILMMKVGIKLLDH